MIENKKERNQSSASVSFFQSEFLSLEQATLTTRTANYSAMRFKLLHLDLF